MNVLTKRLLAAACTVCMLSLAACGNKNSGNSSESSEDPESSLASGELEFVTNPDEPDLGEYTVSEKGTKLYYNPDEISPELMAALEKYFISYSQTDYDAYTECVYPDYITEMNEFLAADYGYDLSKSFENQCEYLKTNAGGDFVVTRIKAELPEEDGSEKCLTALDEVFETDFYENVKANSDALHDLLFYVMAEANGEETLLIQEFEIVFAEKDGKFYTFG